MEKVCFISIYVSISLSHSLISHFHLLSYNVSACWESKVIMTTLNDKATNFGGFKEFFFFFSFSHFWSCLLIHFLHTSSNNQISSKSSMATASVFLLPCLLRMPAGLVTWVVPFHFHIIWYDEGMKDSH